MLLSLTVKNFAILNDIQIDFKDKMTALTGETGAGKSLIIDAIGLLFGQRAQADFVSTGATKAIIEGVFQVESVEVNSFLESLDIEPLDFIFIKREILSSGKSISKVNGEVISNNNLVELSNFIGDIHSQFDTYKLTNSINYFEFIDDESIKTLLIDYNNSLQIYSKLKKEYKEMKERNDVTLQKLDFLEYQLQELSKANLNVNEEEELTEKFNILNNYDKIMTNYQEFIALIENNDLLDNLYNANNYLGKNIIYNQELEEKVNKLNESYYDIKDIFEEIKMIVNNDDYDVTILDEINDRLNIYSSLKKKYKMSTSELIEYRIKIEKEISEVSNFDFYLEEMSNNVNNAYEKAKEKALHISKIRKEKALILESKLLNNLSDLGLKNANLNIVIKENDTLNSLGINDIDLLVSFNKGESLKPLSKTASGGELSRFMLALKSIYCNKYKNKTFIFDEIDTGVSGEIAQRIGEKIKTISENNQVLCVTHLPQVASICDNHIYIYKEENLENKVITRIEELDYEKRVLEIAMMLSKGKTTEASIMLAKELINK